MKVIYINHHDNRHNYNQFTAMVENTLIERLKKMGLLNIDNNSNIKAIGKTGTMLGFRRCRVTQFTALWL